MSDSFHELWQSNSDILAENLTRTGPLAFLESLVLIISTTKSTHQGNFNSFCPALIKITKTKTSQLLTLISVQVASSFYVIALSVLISKVTHQVLQLLDKASQLTNPLSFVSLCLPIKAANFQWFLDVKQRFPTMSDMQAEQCTNWA